MPKTRPLSSPGPQDSVLLTITLFETEAETGHATTLLGRRASQRRWPCKLGSRTPILKSGTGSQDGTRQGKRGGGREEMSPGRGWREALYNVQNSRPELPLEYPGDRSAQAEQGA